MSLSRGAGLGSIGLSNSSPNLGGSGTEDGSDPTTRFAPGANSAWDFINNYARFKDVYYGPLANTPGWSFTRASTGYAQTAAGVLVPFASGELRRTDKGVLIEGARTNLCLQSQTFGTTWSQNNGTVSSDSTSAPDGTTTADSWVASSSANAYIRQSITTLPGSTYVGSVYIKAAVNSWALVEMWNSGTTKWSGTYINLSTGAQGNTTSGGGGLSPTFTITSAGNGWYRLSAAVTTDNAALSMAIYLASGNGNLAVTAGNSIYLWGAQLEAAAFPSSYIPTTTASATRAADVLTVPVSGIDYPLSLFAEFELNASVATSQWALVLSNGTANEISEIGPSGAAVARVITIAGAVQQAAVTAGAAISVGVATKIAARATTNDINIAKGGTLGTADTSATNPATPTTILFGAQSGSVQPLWGYLRRVAVWPRALTDAELQAVTR